jgi:hypothetical protein
MAKYMLLISGDAQQWDALTPEQAKAHDAAHASFRAAAGSKIVGGEASSPDGLTMSGPICQHDVGHGPPSAQIRRAAWSSSERCEAVPRPVSLARPSVRRVRCGG